MLTVALVKKFSTEIAESKKHLMPPPPPPRFVLKHFQRRVAEYSALNNYQKELSEQYFLMYDGNAGRLFR